MMKKQLGALIGVALISLLVFSGCVGMFGRNKSHYRSSVVDFLYPNKNVTEIPDIPKLTVPMNVGLAFVPTNAHNPKFRSASTLNEKAKRDLMERTAEQFKQLPIIEKIEVIPSAYLRPGGSFDNLEQLQTMFGVDVVALLSYDQIQHTDEGFLSLAYWTIVGAYVIQGEKNDTNTVMDAAVYDIATRKMLFRAPGTSQVKASSTLVNLSEELRADSSKGFELATDDLVTNLNSELELFKEKVKNQPTAYAVTYKKGYTGAGSVGPVLSLGVLFCGIAAWRRQKRG